LTLSAVDLSSRLPTLVRRPYVLDVRPHVDGLHLFLLFAQDVALVVAVAVEPVRMVIPLTY
jgi:hypothetical protein